MAGGHCANFWPAYKSFSRPDRMVADGPARDINFFRDEFFGEDSKLMT
jgi:hypothetical protein